MSLDKERKEGLVLMSMKGYSIFPKESDPQIHLHFRLMSRTPIFLDKRHSQPRRQGISNNMNKNVVSRIKLVKVYLFSLFNDINIHELCNVKVFIVEERWWYYLTHGCGTNGVHTFSKGIRPKENIRAHLLRGCSSAH